MEIMPYIVEERKDTGLYNAKLGIWLFLSSEVMLLARCFPPTYYYAPGRRTGRRARPS